MADAEVLRDGDLDVLDVAAIPDRLEDPVGEPQHLEVLHRLLAEIVVEAEDLRLVEGGGHLAVQLQRRVEVVPERLLDHQAGRRIGAGAQPDRAPATSRSGRRSAAPRPGRRRAGRAPGGRRRGRAARPAPRTAPGWRSLPGRSRAEARAPSMRPRRSRCASGPRSPRGPSCGTSARRGDAPRRARACGRGAARRATGCRRPGAAFAPPGPRRRRR